MTTPTRLTTACLAALLALGLAACGGSTPTTSQTSPSVTSAPTTGAAPQNSPAGTSGATTPSVTKVSANTASEDEIAAALASAGVTNPQRWAEEVVEYRPYPTDDPNLTKLRNELAKYNPGQQTIDKIVSVLTP
jgi:hypothetical protein